MALSLFLAKLIGIYMLVIGFLFAVFKTNLEHSVREILSSKGMIFLSGILSLITGLAIVIGHPIYELNWRVLITVLGYLSILQGIVRIILPEKVTKTAMIIWEKGYWVHVIILFVLGAFLTYSGFAHS